MPAMRIPPRSFGESPSDRHSSAANRLFCGMARVESQRQSPSFVSSSPRGIRCASARSCSSSTAGSKSPNEKRRSTSSKAEARICRRRAPCVHCSSSKKRHEARRRLSQKALADDAGRAGASDGADVQAPAQRQALLLPVANGSGGASCQTRTRGSAFLPRFRRFLQRGRRRLRPASPGSGANAASNWRFSVNPRTPGPARLLPMGGQCRKSAKTRRPHPPGRPQRAQRERRARATPTGTDTGAAVAHHGTPAPPAAAARGAACPATS